MPADDNTPVVASPFMGSGGLGYSFGSAFEGACAPNGLVKVGPETSGPKFGTVQFQHFDGYWYSDDTILGFSHMHMSGTGASDYGVLGVMPTDAFDASKTTEEGYASKFDKKTESAVPGYYGVTLANGNIVADITAATHSAYHRYTYPAGATSGVVIFDLDHHLESGTVKDAAFTLDASGAIHGQFRSVGGMSGGFGGYMVYFEARTKKPWTKAVVWSNGAAPADGITASGTGAGFALTFDLADHQPIEFQIALSMVSPAGAAASLAAEQTDWDFEKARARAAAAWDKVLGLITVKGGTAEQRRTFVSSLYHAFMMPTIMSDLDGSYRAVDDQVHHADGFHFVSDMSLWDTYRTLHPLYAIISPDRDLDAVRSLYEFDKLAGFFPKWPIATGEAGTMIGSSAEIVVADAYVKGITGFDAEDCYQRMRAAAMDPNAPANTRGGRNDVVQYMQVGYVPANFHTGSVSRTTEYGNDDFALGQLAAALGHADDAKALSDRSKAYRKIFDPQSGFLWGKNADGKFTSSRGTDPTLQGPDFVEANAWQSMWMAAHDVPGMIELLGGQQAFIDKLTLMFESTKTEWDESSSNPGSHAAPRPYYWAGNEPDVQAPWMFAQAGRPDLTQKWVKWTMAAFFSSAADGLPGNDDGGTMSAWWMFGAMGIFPMPGSDRYVVGAPLFSHIEIAVTGGTFTIDAPGVSDTNLYVQSVMLNGAPLGSPELHHKDLRAGGTLTFVMGAAPGPWGRN